MSSGGALLLSSDEWRALVEGEGGLIELATVALLVVALVPTIAALVALRPGQRLLALWLVAHVLGIIYFAGEEASWGQHLVGWQSGEWFARINQQGETNLHNASELFDSLPRRALFIWCVGAGLLVPLCRRYQRGPADDGWHAFVWPTSDIRLVAWLILLSELPGELFDLFNTPHESVLRVIFHPVNLTEVQENLFAVFILLYTLALYRRLASGDLRAFTRQRKPPTGPTIDAAGFD